MSRTTRRLAGIAVMGVCVAALTAPALAAPATDTTAATKGKSNQLDLQLLSFNDYHGHLEANDPALPLSQDPSQTPVGGVEYLSTHVKTLKAKQPTSTLTVAAGDLIGGSTFLSGIFQDQPSIESLNELGLDVSSVGNHEFDEGTTELKRMVEGGCHPTIGCFKDADGNPIPYEGADFDYLAANVVNTSDGKHFLPPTSVKTVEGVKVGFIGMTLEATNTLVSPGGITSVEFKDEVESANALVDGLTAQGVKTIIVLIHEGLNTTGTYNSCDGISGPILDIAAGLDPEIDMVVTGHTHMPYICNVPDSAGQPRLVTSAASFGQVLTESHLIINRQSGQVMREKSWAANRLVTRTVPKDGAETNIIQFWNALSAPLAARVVGTLAPNTNITGHSNTCRCEETPMADLVADAILWGTKDPTKGGAQLALMNTGGVRASLIYNSSPQGEQPGEITFKETYDVAPFNNILVTVSLTGAQIEQVLNQQYQPVSARGSRPMLSLGVSDGFTYEWTWDGTAPGPNTQPAPGANGHVVPGSMKLNGVPIDPATTYRVGTLNFLQEGGDLFTAFRNGTDKVGGPEDLANLADFFTAHPGLTPPPSRVTGL